MQNAAIREKRFFPSYDYQKIKNGENPIYSMELYKEGNIHIGTIQVFFGKYRLWSQ
jgi:hypothetical protein